MTMPGLRARGGGAGPEASAASEARTALRRGAALLKYCRRCDPHVAHFQLSADETRLEWVSKSGKTKHVVVERVADVLAGRRSESFKRAAAWHPPELCLSVMYFETEADARRSEAGANVPPRSLDLVCASASQARMWVRGIREARERRIHPSGAAGRPAGVREKTTLGARAALTVGVAAGKFAKRTGSSLSSSSYDAAAAEPLREPGDLMMWGRVPSVMALGGSLERRGAWIEWLNPTKVPGTEGLDVESVSVGARHAAAVVRGQGVYTWGDGADGRLGNGTALSSATPSRLFGFGGDEKGGETDGRRVFPDSSVNATGASVSCGGSYTVALTLPAGDDGGAKCFENGGGRCFAWGGGAAAGGDDSAADAVAWMPRRIDGALSIRRVSQISCGAFHAAAVCAGDGACVTWGEGAFHALGHGDRASTATPRRVEGPLVGRHVSHVSCGVWHTAAVVQPETGGGDTSDGELWTWGDAEEGKLGHGSEAAAPEPLPRRVETCPAVTRVSCGQWHTLAIQAGSGALWVCGSVGKVAPARGSSVPELVPLPGGVRGVEEIVSGDGHAVAVSVGRAALFTWGRGKHGALGHGGVTDEPVPREVRALTNTPGRSVLAVECGPASTAAVLSPAPMSRKSKAGLAKTSLEFAVGGSELSSAAGASAGPRTAQVNARRTAAGTVGGRMRRPGCHVEDDGLAQGGGMKTRGAGLAAAAATTSGEAWSDAALRRARGEATSAMREREWLRLEVKELRAELRAMHLAPPGGGDSTSTSGSPLEPASPPAAIPAFGGAALPAFGATADAVAAAVASARRDERDRAASVAAAALKEERERASVAAAALKEERERASASAAALKEARDRAEVLAAEVAEERERADRAVVAREAASKAAEEAAEAAAALEAKTAALEVKMSRAERELAGLRAAAASTAAAASKKAARSPTPALDASTPPTSTTTDQSDPTPLPRVPVPTCAPSPVKGKGSSPPSPLSPLTALARGVLPDSPQLVGSPPPHWNTNGHGNANGHAAPASASQERLAGSTPVGTSTRPDAATAAATSPAVGLPVNGGGGDWVEEVEPGVFMTIAADPITGQHVLKRVRFSKRKFSDGNAQGWWEANRVRIIRSRGLRLQR